jgi:hypothetical protein
MLSLWITRHFIGQVVVDSPHIWWILGQMVLDLVLAALCLVALLCALVGGLTVWGSTSPATLPLDWRIYWAGVHADPGTRVALYMMALTTLVPTMVNLVAGLRALWTQKSRQLRNIALELAAQPEGALFSEVEISDMKQTIGWATLWGYATAGLVVGSGFAVLVVGAFAWVL